jgi:hypothetical protein
MKVPVLKALANPVRAFFVPYNLAMLNFVILLLIYFLFFFPVLIASKGQNAINPLFFLIAVIITHSILAFWSKKEPFLYRIIKAKIRLYGQKIPKKLVV